MLATFCARIALGLVASLLLLSPRQLHPRFFRTHFLTALGLVVVTAFTGWPEEGWAGPFLILAVVLTLLGCVSWSLEPAVAGRTLIVLTCVTLVAVFWLLPLLEPDPMWTVTPKDFGKHPSPRSVSALLGDLTSAALLGTALTAMLVGHSYLISPGMSLMPLMRCLAAGGVALLVRVAVIGWGLWQWTEVTPTYTLNDEVVLLLPVRWLVGVVAPLGFGWMAYASARIRSTQSATGILYVVVVCEFLGELLGLVLTRQTGLPL